MKLGEIFKLAIIGSVILLAVCQAFAQDPTPEQINQAKEILKNNPSLRSELLGNAQARTDTSAKIPDSTVRRKLTTYSTDTLGYFDGKMSDSNSKDSASIADSINAITDSIPPERYGMHLFSEEYHIETVSDVPEDYVIVPGDQILLRLWGRYNLEKIYTLGDDGYVFIDPLNKQTYLKGMSHKRVKQMIRNIVSDMAGVEGEAKIISAHPIRINISGNAKIPGTILIPPYFTFWQALKTSKGPSEFGSLRDIRFIRNGKIIHKLDIYEYLKTGKIPSLALKENDLVFYGPIENSVEVKGGFKRKGIYEIKKTEKFGDLVEHAGGFSKKEISPILQIERTIPIQKRKPDGRLKAVIDVNITEKGWDKIALEESDIITSLIKKSEFQNNVFLQGKGIKIPGRYSLATGNNTLADIISKAGGMREGYKPTFEIIRNIPTGKKSLFFEIKEIEDLQKFKLVANDSILTYHKSDFVDSTTIKLTGFVRDSVEILFTENLTLKKVIQRAGGLKDGGLPYVYVKRSDDFHRISYEKINLSESDTYILQRRDEVLAFGYYNFNQVFPVIALMEGKEPLFLDYSENLSLEVIIHQLGGLLPNLDSTNVEINSPEFTSNETYVHQKTVSLSKKNLKEAKLIMPGSMIIFRNDAKKQAPGFVHLLGEFNNPGRYALRNTKESFTSILKQAGGFTNRANPYSISIHRRDVEKPLPIRIKDDDPLEIEGEWLLTNGDSIFVRRNDFMVEIDGAVLNPSVVQWTKKYTWRDYMNSGGGGPLDTADVKRTYVIYPNGVTVKAKTGWMSSSEILPGSKIIVPFKPYKPPSPPKKPFDYNAFVAILSASLGILLIAITISDKVAN